MEAKFARLPRDDQIVRDRGPGPVGTKHRVPAAGTRTRTTA